MRGDVGVVLSRDALKMNGTIREVQAQWICTRFGAARKLTDGTKLRCTYGMGQLDRELVARVSARLREPVPADQQFRKKAQQRRVELTVADR